jgi:hypothetical protein
MTVSPAETSAGTWSFKNYPIKKPPEGGYVLREMKGLMQEKHAA